MADPDALRDLVAAAIRARDVLRDVSLERRKLGPIATQAQTAARQLSAALNALEALGRDDPK